MVRHILLWVVSGFFMFPWSVQLMGRRNYIFSHPPIFVYVCASMHPCMLGQRHYQLPCHKLVMKFKEYVDCRPEKTWLIFGRVVWANLLMILACIDRCMHSSECCVVAVTITTTFSFCLTGVSHHALKRSQLVFVCNFGIMLRILILFSLLDLEMNGTLLYKFQPPLRFINFALCILEHSLL